MFDGVQKGAEEMFHLYPRFREAPCRESLLLAAYAAVHVTTFVLTNLINVCILGVFFTFLHFLSAASMQEYPTYINIAQIMVKVGFFGALFLEMASRFDQTSIQASRVTGLCCPHPKRE